MIGRMKIGLATAAMLALLGGCVFGGSQETVKPLVLVAGATGGTGQAAVEQALEKGYAVRVLVRDKERASTLFGDRVSYAIGDVREPRSLRAAVRGARYVISAVGSSAARDPENSPELVDYGGVKALAEASKMAGVEQFVLTSSMGVTNPDHQLNQILDNILQWKLKGENAVRATGINYTIVRPGGLTNGPGGQSGIKVLQGDPREAVGRISRNDVGAVLIQALGRKEAYGKTFEIVGDSGVTSVDWDNLFAGLKPDVG
jgi:uncharacterized protein YbjT (DUF2867 family)